MSALDRTMCRLRAARWMALEAQATLDCVAAMDRGDRIEGRAHEVWAELCALRVQAWEEEAERS
jgi:hypothetical protein